MGQAPQTWSTTISRSIQFKHIFNWLNHSPKPSRDMINREFAMAFRSGAYKRYNSFNSVQDFKAQIEKANPDRFEIGAIYNKPPRERDTLLKSELKALEKELVFDIDMDDYDAFRNVLLRSPKFARSAGNLYLWQ